MKTYMTVAGAFGAMAMMRGFDLHSRATFSPSDDGMETEEFSLADLADLDVSDIEEIRFENLPGGAYEFEVVDAKLQEGVNKDNEKRFTAEFSVKVLECKAVMKAGVDKESLVGKVHTEKLYINPAKEPTQAIGRIRAFVSDLGLDSSGKLGPMIEATKGHIFKGKIATRKDKDDPSVEYARLQLEKKK